MTRQEAIATIKYAGYHNDKKTMTRIYIENRLNYHVAQVAFSAGIKNRENGMKCSCLKCQG